MSRFASSKRALGICDNCGFQYRLNELKETIVRGRPTNLLFCPECWGPDHPQNELGRFKVVDPQALQNPRPDSAELRDSRNFQWGWDPVGGGSDDSLTKNNLKALASIGSVTITVAINPSTVTISGAGIEATGYVNGVTVNNPPSFDSSTVTLDSTTDTFDEG